MHTLTDLSDTELSDLRLSVVIEQERRVNLAAIPAQITALSAQYIEAGGEQIALDEAVAAVDVVAVDVAVEAPVPDTLSA